MFNGESRIVGEFPRWRFVPLPVEDSDDVNQKAIPPNLGAVVHIPLVVHLLLRHTVVIVETDMFPIQDRLPDLVHQRQVEPGPPH